MVEGSRKDYIAEGVEDSGENHKAEGGVVCGKMQVVEHKMCIV